MGFDSRLIEPMIAIEMFLEDLIDAGGEGEGFEGILNRMEPKWIYILCSVRTLPEDKKPPNLINPMQIYNSPHLARM
jgi:hypothetical protein